MKIESRSGRHCNIFTQTFWIQLLSNIINFKSVVDCSMQQKFDLQNLLTFDFIGYYTVRNNNKVERHFDRTHVSNLFIRVGWELFASKFMDTSSTLGQTKPAPL